MTSASNTPELLEVLARHGVEFIVVGVIAAVLQGAPVVTFDLDIAYARTQFGPLDVLGVIDNDAGYDELLPHAVRLDVGGRSIAALGLERLIEVKPRAGRPKDLAVHPVLRATLARSARND